MWHEPALVEQVLHFLAPRPGDLIVDGTVGAGGHSAAIAPRLAPGGRLIGLDRDAQVLELARERLATQAHVTLWQANFGDLAAVLSEHGLTAIDGLVLDVGVSSVQLDTPERGFSFMHDAPLDMRMDQAQPVTAASLVNRLPERELADLLYKYGEERGSRRIARAIVEARRRRPIRTTGELAGLVRQASPRPRRESTRRRGLDPATRTFQALRIVVNQELEALERVLAQAPTLMARGGRVVIISFHSLEDRVVKRAFQSWVKAGGWQLLTRKPVEPTAEAVTANRRIRSAKLRAIRRGETP
ncbi:MAG: 16S rRNA (cytosine(1402)-N(4))-methyltransferase RsmH [Candidatus Omnitrophica bacterium]|nr:16S rRNA (cytosine(1402)-N(4))-methyltransferase RsmH [Candidatus Omnitrophota bacterium]